MQVHLEFLHVQQDFGVLEVRRDEFQRLQEYLEQGQAGVRVAALQDAEDSFCVDADGLEGLTVRPGGCAWVR